MKEQVKRFQPNTKGRDFVVGDLHGCYNEFIEVLKHINFNVKTDRIFSVGDIIDKGPDSYKMITNIANRKWFYQILGNHESLLMHHKLTDFVGNSWAREILKDDKSKKKKKLLEYIEKCKNEIPHAFVIDSKNSEDKYVITHAEPPAIMLHGEDCRTLDYFLDHEFSDSLRLSGSGDNTLWGRSLDCWYKELPYFEGIKLFLHGHNIVDSPKIVGDCLLIDTGFFKGIREEFGTLTLFELQDDIIHSIGIDFKKCKVAKHDIDTLNNLKFRTELENSLLYD